MIDRNGDNLRRCVLRHAEAWNLGAEFRRWVEGHNHFLNTLVDRIVSGYPRDEAARLATNWATRTNVRYRGTLSPVGHRGPASWHANCPSIKAGLNVVWTGDLTPYRTRKVRILNGAHTTAVADRLSSGAGHGPRNDA